MMSQLAVLQVAVPLLAAPLCVLARNATVAWIIFCGAALASLLIAIALTLGVISDGAWQYAIGGWAPPFGIEYVIDAVNAPLLLLISALAVATGVYARRSVMREIDPQRAYLYYACLSLYLTGLLGITATGDAFNVFVFLEISSLSAYALIAMGRHRRALLASFRYLIMGTVGGTFLLIGIGLLYALTGSLNMADLAERVPALYGHRVLSAALGFITVGLAIKAAVFPLHAWQPDAYAEAPSAASLLLAGAGAKVALYAFLRYAYGVFGVELFAEVLPLAQLALAVGVVAMLIGAGAACFQTDFKRLLAWSSIGQVGYIVAGMGLASDAGLQAAMLHLVNHGLIKAGLFAAAGIVVLRVGGSRLDDFAGLAKRMPWTFAALLLGGLGLIGVPLTAGFVSKWALVQALIDAGHWWVLVAVLLSSLLALIYVGRVIEIAWFREPSVAQTDTPISAGAMPVATWALVLLSLWLGLDSSALQALAASAAQTLMGMAP